MSCLNRFNGSPKWWISKCYTLLQALTASGGRDVLRLDHGLIQRKVLSLRVQTVHGCNCGGLKENLHGCKMPPTGCLEYHDACCQHSHLWYETVLWPMNLVIDASIQF